MAVPAAAKEEMRHAMRRAGWNTPNLNRSMYPPVLKRRNKAMTELKTKTPAGKYPSALTDLLLYLLLQLYLFTYSDNFNCAGQSPGPACR